jgi:hypothetical protein
MALNPKSTLLSAAAGRPGARRPQARRFSLTRSLTPLLLAVVSALIVLPTTIVVTFALIPSLAALVVDEGRPRYLFRTVLGMNLAALWPHLEQLWLGGNELRGAVAIVGDVYAWAAVYGAAAAGWLIYLSAPPLVAGLRSLNDERRIRKLKERQKVLLAEWGDALPAADEAKPKAEEREEPAAASG